MKQTHRQTSTNLTSIADGTPRIASLLAEREAMREEIRQLSAAVQVYAEVVRRMESTAPGVLPEAKLFRPGKPLILW